MSLQTKEVCVCDGCGIERNKDTNHWWITRRYSYGPVDEMAIRRFTEWDDREHLAEIRHFCGMTCAIRFVSDAMLEMVKKETVKA